MGPKLLVSDLSTADQPVLRWRVVVRGNTAVEFGVVPLSMVVSNEQHERMRVVLNVGSSVECFSHLQLCELQCGHGLEQLK